MAWKVNEKFGIISPMKSLTAILSSIAACAFFGGCYSLVSASSESLGQTRVIGATGSPSEHVVVSNYGWYLFNRWPIVCGNSRDGAFFPFVFFRDDVTANLLHGKLTGHAAKRNAQVAELNLFFDENVIIEIPGTSIPIPIPYVLCYHERTVSGLLMNPAQPTSAPVPPAEEVRQVPQSAPQDAERKQEVNRLLDKIPDGGVK